MTEQTTQLATWLAERLAHGATSIELASDRGPAPIASWPAPTSPTHALAVAHEITVAARAEIERRAGETVARSITDGLGQSAEVAVAGPPAMQAVARGAVPAIYRIAVDDEPAPAPVAPGVLLMRALDSLRPFLRDAPPTSILARLVEILGADAARLERLGELLTVTEIASLAELVGDKLTTSETTT